MPLSSPYGDPNINRTKALFRVDMSWSRDVHSDGGVNPVLVAGEITYPQLEAEYIDTEFWEFARKVQRFEVMILRPVASWTKGYLCHVAPDGISRPGDVVLHNVFLMQWTTGYPNSPSRRFMTFRYLRRDVVDGIPSFVPRERIIDGYKYKLVE